MLALTAQARRHHLPNKARAVSAIAPELRAALRACITGSSPWPLLVYGPPGTGKTCAALCLLDHLAQGVGLYFTAQALAEEVIAGYKGQLESCSGRPLPLRQLWRDISETTLVVVDELGNRATVSDHQYDVFKRLLDEREGKPLLCISNHGIGTLGRAYDDRVASRLAAGTALELTGDDRRLRH